MRALTVAMLCSALFTALFCAIIVRTAAAEPRTVTVIGHTGVASETALTVR
jgi:hypothetical protein